MEVMMSPGCISTSSARRIVVNLGHDHAGIRVHSVLLGQFLGQRLGGQAKGLGFGDDAGQGFRVSDLGARGLLLSLNLDEEVFLATDNFQGHIVVGGLLGDSIL